jgi:flagellar hook protein FlgE
VNEESDMSTTKEITIEQLLDSYDWEEVFGEGSGGNTDKRTEPVPPDSNVSIEPASRTDVAEIIAAVNGQNDESEWIGVFKLKDGRYLVAIGGCDYTGWDCQASNNMATAYTLDDAIRFGLDDSQRARLGLSLESA